MTAYEMRISDWSSDVFSSDLQPFRLTKCRPSVPPWGMRPFFCLRAAAGATGNLRFMVKALARPTVRAEHERHVRPRRPPADRQRAGVRTRGDAAGDCRRGGARADIGARRGTARR